MPARISKPQAHRLKCKLVVASRIVHPEIERQTSDHRGGNTKCMTGLSSYNRYNCTEGMTHQPDQLLCCQINVGSASRVQHEMIVYISNGVNSTSLDSYKFIMVNNHEAKQRIVINLLNCWPRKYGPGSKQCWR
jgi:hypothetical protein